MTDRNANRKGYKKTPVGWIPEEWECVKAGDVYDIQLGKMLSAAARQGANPQPYLANFNVRWASFDLTHIQKMDFSAHELRKFELRQGDLLVCEGGEPGRAAIWNETIKPCYYQKAIHRLRKKSPRIDNQFMQAFLERVAGSSIILNFTSQTSIAHLTREKLQLLPISLPPLPEQKKIAEILSTWDEAIAQTRALLAAAKRRKKALMQQLLTGKTRLPGFTIPWSQYYLGDLFTERNEADHNHLPLLAITRERGIIPASDVEKKDSSNPDKSLYKRIAPGDIGYNTMRMWQGVSAVSAFEGIVSPAYTVCMPATEIDAVFAGYLFKYAPVIHVFWRHSQGLVDDTLSLKYHNFARIRLSFPALSEQRAIAVVLTTADEEIKSLEAKCAALERQKKGLMQKLLTGEVRVRTQDR